LENKYFNGVLAQNVGLNVNDEAERSAFFAVSLKGIHRSFHQYAKAVTFLGSVILPQLLLIFKPLFPCLGIKVNELGIVCELIFPSHVGG